MEASALKTRDPDEAAARAALRSRIAEEVVRQGGHPLARRTLGLLAEAAIVAQVEPPGYRILDRAGQPRRIADPVPPAEAKVAAAAAGETGPDRDMTLADVVRELRTLHPTLFVEPEAVPVTPVGDRAAADVPGEEPLPPAVQVPAHQVPSLQVPPLQVPTARAPAVLARAVLTRSATRGRALAARATEGWQGLRLRFTPNRTGTSAATAAPTEATAPPGSHPASALRRAVGLARSRFADAGARLSGREGGALRDRRVLAAAAGLLGVAVLIVLLSHSDEESAAPSVPPATTPRTEAPATASPVPTETPPVVEEASKPAGEASKPAGEASKPAGEAPKPTGERAASPLTGPVEVIDTATLRVAGKLVRLFGVEWVRGGQADELTRYLAGRTVTCQPVAGSEARLCNVEGRDLSEVVLFNGGGRASSEATPDLVAAEDRARTERLGVWAR